MSINAWTGIAGYQLLLDAAVASSVVLDANGVNQWTDQSGNGYHATQSTNAAKPRYPAGLPVPMVMFPAIEGGQGRILANAASSINLYISTVMLVIDADGWNTNGLSDGMPFIEIGGVLFLQNAAGYGTQALDVLVYPYSTPSASNVIPCGSRTIVHFVTTNGTTVLYVNGVLQGTVATGVANSAQTGYTLGQYASNTALNYQGGIAFAGVWTVAFTSQNIADSTAYAQSKYQIGSTLPYRLVCGGDSLTKGQGAAYINGLTLMRLMALPGNVEVFNLSKPGADANSIISDQANYMTPLYTSSKKCGFFGWIGTNGFASSAATEYGYIKTYLQNAATAGFNPVIAGTAIPRGDTFSLNASFIAPLNALLKADFTTPHPTIPFVYLPNTGVTYATHLIDNASVIAQFGASSASGAPGAVNPDVYYSDNVHLIEDGYRLLAAPPSQLIQSLWYLQANGGGAPSGPIGI